MNEEQKAAVKALSDYQMGVEDATENIIKMLEPEVARHYELGLGFTAAYLEKAIAKLKESRSERTTN